GWFKSEVKRCNGTGAGSICLDNSGCAANEECLLDTADYPCPVNDPDTQIKTIGWGGPGNIVYQPTLGFIPSTVYWAGLCPAADSGCSEYIDPVSSFNQSLLFNGDFSQNVDAGTGDTIADGWTNDTQSVGLQSYTAYILSVQGLNWAILDPPTAGEYFYRFSETNNNFVSAVNVSVDNTTTNGQNSVMFITKDVSNISFKLSVTNSGHNNGSKVELKPAAIDYQLKSGVDNSTCNGQVNLSDGCVLFNQRTVSKGDIYSTLTFDADNSPNTAGNPANCLASPCDSNVLLKVSPDRVCKQWLACRSYVKDENDNNVCYDVGLCDRYSQSGDCANFVVSDQVNQSYDNDNDPAVPNLYPGDIADMSGYTLAGHQNSDENTDFYPLASMDQSGEVALVPNGSFELYGENGYPYGWEVRDSGIAWDRQFSVIDNPYDAQQEGIKYPIDGKSLLKFSVADRPQNAYSEYIDVEPDTDYVISGYINTLNLHSKNDIEIGMYVDVNPFNKTGTEITGGLGIYNYQTGNNNRALILTESGRDWQFYLGKFRTDTNVTKLRIQLVGYADGIWDCFDGEDVNGIDHDNCAGNVYIDDLKLRPALDSRDNWLTAQSCRLYPEDDSLGCDYYDDSGIRQKGWPGYCLQYDRYPGSKDTCLMWYPVDRVKGDGIEEGAGYIGAYPLYYTSEEAYETIVSRYSGDSIYANPYGYRQYTSDQIGAVVNTSFFPLEILLNKNFIESIRVSNGNLDVYLTADNNWGACCYGSRCSIPDDDFDYCDKRWYYRKDTCRAGGTCHHCHTEGAQASFDDNGMLDGIEFHACDISGSMDAYTFSLSYEVITQIPYSNRIVRVVTLIGQNKFWSGRVYEGSEFIIPCNFSFPSVGGMCSYISDYRPFGRVVPPAYHDYEFADPSTWDSKENIIGIQPLYYEFPDTSLTKPYQPRMGQMHTAETVQRLFAKSYGTWEWDALTCVGGAKDGYSCITGENCQSPCLNYCYANVNGIVLGGNCDTVDSCEPYVDSVCIAGFCEGGCLNGGPCSIDDDCQSGECIVSATSTLCEGGINNGIACPGGDVDCEIPNCYSCDNSTRFCEANPGMACVDDSTCAGTCAGTGIGSYVKVDGEEWEPPEDICDDGLSNNIRPTINIIGATTLLCNGGDCFDCPGPTCDYCGIKPEIFNMRVDGEAQNHIVSGSGFLKFTFNSKVDGQQLPLVMYAVDWQDRDKTVVTGVEMRDRPNDDNPHVVYHAYSYWELIASESGSSGLINCGSCQSNFGTDGPCCAVRPSVKVKDNWGWCNNGIDGTPCPLGGYQQYGSWIIVTRD
ncbi:hypothetical protein DRH27_03885, partial [Candidatus Falkowbacteria bacterium]